MKQELSLTKIFFNFILFLCVYYLGFTFIAASLDKIIDPYTFSRSISDYEITPNWISNFVSIILPWIELFCGFLLIVCFSKKINKFYLIDVSNNFIILMLLWFIFILSIAWIKGLDIDCGCGLSEKATPLDRLKEDIVLLISSFIIKFRDKISFFLNINN